MTRRDSLGDLERRLEGLDSDVGTAREWADRYLDRRVAEHGFDVRFSPPDDNGATRGSSESMRIPIRESPDGFTFYARRSDVPEWIDRENLPVEA